MLVRARHLVPAAGSLVPNGALRLRDGRIAWSGPWPDAARAHGEPVLDLGDAVLIPGLVNAHCHLDYTSLAGQLAPPKAFPDWIKAILAAKSSCSEEDFDRSWLLGAAQLLQSGTTTVANIETRPHALARLRDATPLRIHSFAELTGVRAARNPRTLVEEAAATLASLPVERGALGLSPHAPYSTLPDLLVHASTTARRRGWRLTSHIAESREEFEMFMYRRGPMHDWLRSQRPDSDCGLGSPVRHAAANGLLGPDFIAVHVNYLWDDDARLLGSHGVSVAHCPRSHAYFQHRRFPSQELAEAGVNLCLGTDSLASTRTRPGAPATLSMFDEMQELAAHDDTLTPAEILARATVHGARALGLEGSIGTLHPGGLADFCALPARAADADLHEAILHHHGPVLATWIGGVQVWGNTHTP